MRECPFCGKHQWSIQPNSLDACSVMCRNCGARGPEALTSEGAFDAWNERINKPTPPPDQRDTA